MSVDISFHYPADLMNLLVETIPLLNRAKKDVFVFFKGAGVSADLATEIYTKWQQDQAGVTKYEIVRSILVKLNIDGDRYLRERREVLKRVVEFDSFSSCWPDDILKAKGFVAEIKQLTDLKDSVTKIVKEHEKKRQEEIRNRQAKTEAQVKKRNELAEIKTKLFALFSETNPQLRGKALEPILNNLFKVYGINVREAFTLKGFNSGGIVEQIDGVIEFDNALHLVEMKWWRQPVGVPEISAHISRVFLRANVRGVLISASEFTEPAIACCREALQQKTIFLVSLHEIVSLLDSERDLVNFLTQKSHAAIIDKNPWLQILS